MEASISRIFGFIPDWAAGVGIVTLAVLLALSLYIIAAKTLLTLTQRRGTFIRSLFLRVKRILCLALVLIAISLAVQLPYFPESSGALVSKLLSAAVIGMIGWFAIVAMDLASSLYLRQYNVETADDLLARKHFTQVRVLRRAVDVLIILITVAAGLMAFEPVRQFGVSLFASAGAAGLVVGFAARPVLSNLIAGIQLAITQPIRIKDAVLVEGEWGWIEEITSTYVVVKIWDWRRLIVPLSYFMEKPFQNWTRETAEIIGTVFIYTDYRVPVERLRKRLEEIVHESTLWDKNVVNLQVTDFKESAVEIRVLVSARTSPQVWDLRCEVREKLLAYLQCEVPDALPHTRILLEQQSGAAAAPYLQRSAYGQHRPRVGDSQEKP